MMYYFHNNNNDNDKKSKTNNILPDLIFTQNMKQIYVPSEEIKA